jgi:hypothetical protein
MTVTETSFVGPLHREFPFFSGFLILFRLENYIKDFSTAFVSHTRFETWGGGEGRSCGIGGDDRKA